MSSYQFLDAPKGNYKHEIHIHGPNGNFGFGLHSTSPIEGVWSILKSNIKKIYNYVPSKNLVLFLKEAEMPYNLRKFSNLEKETEFKSIMEYLYDTCDYDLYDLDELSDNINYSY